MELNRLEYFSQKTIDELMKVTYKDMLLKEIEELIADTPMKDVNKRIAKCLFIDVLNYRETADKLYLDKRTISTHREDITNMLRLTLVKKVMEYKGFKDTPSL